MVIASDGAADLVVVEVLQAADDGEVLLLGLGASGLDLVDAGEMDGDRLLGEDVLTSGAGRPQVGAYVGSCYRAAALRLGGLISIVKKLSFASTT
jgi:hypothetical protein